MILAERAARLEAEAVNTSAEAQIAHMKLEIEKLRRALYGHRSERTARLLEQMELQLEELETAASEDELAAEKAAARACGDPGALLLSILRLGEAVEAGRRHYRNAGSDTAPMESHPDCL